MTEEELQAGIESLPSVERIKLALMTVAQRAILHGTTLSTPQMTDTLMAMLDAYRLAVAVDFMKRVMFGGKSPNAKLVEALGPIGPSIMKGYLTTIAQLEREGRKCQLLVEAAFAAEPKKETADAV